MGRSRAARASKYMLAIIAAAVPTEGQSRVNPSVNFSPIAQPISKTPAATRRDHEDILYLQRCEGPRVPPNRALAGGVCAGGVRAARGRTPRMKAWAPIRAPRDFAHRGGPPGPG